MKGLDIWQFPLFEETVMVGWLTETHVLTFLLDNPMLNAEKPVREIMGKPFPMVNADLPLTRLCRHISKEIPAVITQDRSGGTHIVTQYDLIQAI